MQRFVCIQTSSVFQLGAIQSESSLGSTLNAQLLILDSWLLALDSRYSQLAISLLNSLKQLSSQYALRSFTCTSALDTARFTVSSSDRWANLTTLVVVVTYNRYMCTRARRCCPHSITYTFPIGTTTTTTENTEFVSTIRFLAFIMVHLWVLEPFFGFHLDSSVAWFV